MSIYTMKVNRIAPTLNRWQRMSFWARKAHKEAWMKEFLAQRPTDWQTLDRFKVSVVRGYAGVPADKDNLVASCKPILDALVRTDMIADDNPDQMVDLHVKQLKMKKKDLCTMITLSSCEPTEK